MLIILQKHFKIFQLTRLPNGGTLEGEYLLVKVQDGGRLGSYVLLVDHRPAAPQKLALLWLVLMVRGARQLFHPATNTSTSEEIHQYFSALS